MKDRQIIFGFATGTIVACAGLAIISFSQTGWNLLLVGVALVVLASLEKAKSAKAAHKVNILDSAPPCQIGGKDPAGV